MGFSRLRDAWTSVREGMTRQRPRVMGARVLGVAAAAACVAGALLTTSEPTNAQPRPVPTVRHPIPPPPPHRPIVLHRTGGAHLTDKQITHLALTQKPKAEAYLAEEKRNLGARFKAADASCQHQSSYDLRKKGLSTPVHDQGTCGSCWDFAAVAALESSWKMVNGEEIGASEQQILNCASAAGTCNGGTPGGAFIFLQFTGIPPRSDVPYNPFMAQSHSCSNEVQRRYSAATWGFVGGLNPSVADIKAAICEHGAIAAPINASDPATPPNGRSFQEYRGDEGDIAARWPGQVFNEQANPLTTNHVITIIGWDDAKQAWLIKNSWGGDTSAYGGGWGITAGDPSPHPQIGYAWIHYGANDIARFGAWVHARKACPGGGEYDAGLCYNECKANYHGLGPLCCQNCPAGYHDDGCTCRVPIETYPKKSHTRGAGTPMGCSPNEQQGGALCYAKCPADYKEVPPLCWQNCRPGYTDEGALCGKSGSIITANNSRCHWYDKCGLTFDKGCSTCPAGYHNDGCTCRIDPDVYAKHTVGLGVGTVLHACPAGQERSGALCYPACPSGFKGVGPVCWEECKPGFSDDGVFCGKGGQVTISNSYGRGVGKIPP